MAFRRAYEAFFGSRGEAEDARAGAPRAASGPGDADETYHTDTDGSSYSFEVPGTGERSPPRSERDGAGLAGEDVRPAPGLNVGVRGREPGVRKGQKPVLNASNAAGGNTRGDGPASIMGTETNGVEGKERFPRPLRHIPPILTVGELAKVDVVSDGVPTTPARMQGKGDYFPAPPPPTPVASRTARENAARPPQAEAAGQAQIGLAFGGAQGGEVSVTAPSGMSLRPRDVPGAKRGGGVPTSSLVGGAVNSHVVKHLAIDERVKEVDDAGEASLMALCRDLGLPDTVSQASGQTGKSVPIGERIATLRRRAKTGLDMSDESVDSPLARGRTGKRKGQKSKKNGASDRARSNVNEVISVGSRSAAAKPITATRRRTPGFEGEVVQRVETGSQGGREDDIALQTPKSTGRKYRVDSNARTNKTEDDGEGSGGKGRDIADGDIENAGSRDVGSRGITHQSTPVADVDPANISTAAASGGDRQDDRSRRPSTVRIPALPRYLDGPSLPPRQHTPALRSIGGPCESVDEQFHNGSVRGDPGAVQDHMPHAAPAPCALVVPVVGKPDPVVAKTAITALLPQTGRREAVVLHRGQGLRPGVSGNLIKSTSVANAANSARAGPLAAALAVDKPACASELVENYNGENEATVTDKETEKFSPAVPSDTQVRAANIAQLPFSSNSGKRPFAELEKSAPNLGGVGGGEEGLSTFQPESGTRPKSPEFLPPSAKKPRLSLREFGTGHGAQMGIGARMSPFANAAADAAAAAAVTATTAVQAALIPKAAAGLLPRRPPTAPSTPIGNAKEKSVPVPVACPQPVRAGRMSSGFVTPRDIIRTLQNRSTTRPPLAPSAQDADMEGKRETQRFGSAFLGGLDRGKDRIHSPRALSTPSLGIVQSRPSADSRRSAGLVTDLRPALRFGETPPQANVADGILGGGRPVAVSSSAKKILASLDRVSRENRASSVKRSRPSLLGQAPKRRRTAQPPGNGEGDHVIGGAKWFMNSIKAHSATAAAKVTNASPKSDAVGRVGARRKRLVVRSSSDGTGSGIAAAGLSDSRRDTGESFARVSKVDGGVSKKRKQPSPGVGVLSTQALDQIRGDIERESRPSVQPVFNWEVPSEPSKEKPSQAFQPLQSSTALPPLGPSRQVSKLSEPAQPPKPSRPSDPTFISQPEASRPSQFMSQSEVEKPLASIPTTVSAPEAHSAFVPSPASSSAQEDIASHVDKVSAAVVKSTEAAEAVIQKGAREKEEKESHDPKTASNSSPFFGYSSPEKKSPSAVDAGSEKDDGTPALPDPKPLFPFGTAAPAPTAMFSFSGPGVEQSAGATATPTPFKGFSLGKVDGANADFKPLPFPSFGTSDKADAVGTSSKAGDGEEKSASAPSTAAIAEVSPVGEKSVAEHVVDANVNEILKSEGDRNAGESEDKQTDDTKPEKENVDDSSKRRREDEGGKNLPSGIGPTPTSLFANVEATPPASASAAAAAVPSFTFGAKPTGAVDEKKTAHPVAELAAAPTKPAAPTTCPAKAASSSSVFGTPAGQSSSEPATVGFTFKSPFSAAVADSRPGATAASSGGFGIPNNNSAVALPTVEPSSSPFAPSFSASTPASGLTAGKSSAVPASSSAFAAKESSPSLPFSTAFGSGSNPFAKASPSSDAATSELAPASSPSPASAPATSPFVFGGNPSPAARAPTITPFSSNPTISAGFGSNVSPFPAQTAPDSNPFSSFPSALPPPKTSSAPSLFSFGAPSTNPTPPSQSAATGSAAVLGSSLGASPPAISGFGGPGGFGGFGGTPFGGGQFGAPQPPVGGAPNPFQSTSAFGAGAGSPFGNGTGGNQIAPFGAQQGRNPPPFGAAAGANALGFAQASPGQPTPFAVPPVSSSNPFVPGAVGTAAGGAQGDQGFAVGSNKATGGRRRLRGRRRM